MPPPLTPGVYIEEVPGGGRTITGVATSIALFIGWAAKGPIDRAERILSFADYERTYGPLDRRTLLGYAVQQFFTNGGSDAYVIRVAAGTAVLDPNSTDAALKAAFHSAVLAVFNAGGIAHAIDLFNIVCVPGESDSATIQKLQTACKERRAFLVVDCTERATVSTAAAEMTAMNGADRSHAAYYLPWVQSPDPLQAGAVRAFPPCGFVAGIYARTDASRGAWKAPAGTDATLAGAAGFTLPITDAENGTLNPKAVNCLRTLPGYGNVIWGSRTMDGANDRGSEWKYVPVRRLTLFLEESLFRGTQWAIFEPNGEPLWAHIRLSVGAFMQTLFRQGAFQGTTAREAYFVKCDRETTAQADIDLGLVNIHVGFAPLKPAEFIVIHIRQITAEH